MRWLLSDEEYARAAQEIRRGEVTRELYAFLGRVVTALVRSGGLAPALSPTGRWDDDTLKDVLQEWLAEQLLPGGLARAFQVTASPKALARYMERALRNWLISKSRARSQPRLLARVRHLLQERDSYRKFVDAQTPSDQWWGLASWDSPAPFQGTDGHLSRAAFSVGDLTPLRYTTASSRADPVISNPDLDRFLYGVLDAIGALLTLRHFDIALRRRFAYAYYEETELLSSIQETADDLTPPEAIEVEVTAKEILIELTGRQVKIVADRVERQLTLDEIAGRHAVSRGTVDNELRRTARIMRRHLLNDSEFEAVLETLFRIAFEEEG